ncbi:putative polysaccharide biosynthesis protein [Bacillus cihuensis]|uniref:putative polysaccharide biosynthesis protein n=1 Tax=Bacillus cihuensis TaxID=1208599 RepID=UPI000427233E|nr:polysaccharide biosynthesis protein [Bacillus cihuensis]
MVGDPIKTTRELVRGALILSIASLIVKVLSAAYRIPYQNIAGDIGFYIYQQVYPFYGIVLTLSTLGFPAVISKLLAERDESEEGFSVNEILMSSLTLLGALGIVLFGSLFFFADSIARVMGDTQLAGLLKIIAFSFLLMPATSVIRGYYQGQGNMIPTALSQVLEQLIRVTTILLLSFLLIRNGYSLYTAGKGAVFGSVTGGLTGLFILLGFIILRKEWSNLKKIPLRLRKFPFIMKALIFQGFSFCITGLILVLIQLVDSLQLYNLLQEIGFGAIEAKEWKGVYDRGQPLIQLGTVIVTSVSLTMIPIIALAMRKRDNEELMSKIRLTLKLSISVGIAASCGLICLIKPVNVMLFTDMKGSGTLAILAVSILFSSVIIAQSAILQSMGHTWAPIVVVGFGLVCKWILNKLLVPYYSIEGAAIATVLCFILMALLLAIFLQTKVSMPLFEKTSVYIIIGATVTMVVTLIVYNQLFQFFQLSGRFMSSVQALTGVSLGGTLFIYSILKTRLFTKNELLLLPLGEKLVTYLHKEEYQ